MIKLIDACSTWRGSLTMTRVMFNWICKFADRAMATGLTLACWLLGGLSVSSSAWAASYSFPGALPGGCSGSGTSYTCGALSLSSGDTVTVVNPSTTITLTSLSANNAQINAAGVANLTLTMTGALTAASGATIKGNVNSGSVVSSGAVTYGGSITTTGGGAISLGAGTNVAGTLTTVTGAITLLTGTAVNYTTVGGVSSGGTLTINSYNRIDGDTVAYLLSAAGHNVFNGSITTTTTYVSLGGNATVNGSIYSQTYVDTGGSSNITGSITSATSYIDTGAATTVGGSLNALGTYVDIHGSATIGGGIKAQSYVSMTTNSSVGGNITANSTIAMGTGSTSAKCVRSTGASTITVPSAAAVAGACCGAGSTCTSTCVSGTPKPATCSWPSSGLFAEYSFEQNSYDGTDGEVLDSSGNKRHGKIVGGASSTSSGKFCRGLLIPRNLTTAIDAFDTGIDVNAIGNSGTVAFWYKSVTTGVEHRMLYDASSSSSNQFYLYRDDANSGVDLNAYTTDGGGTSRNVDKLNAMSDATWTHVVVTWKFTTGTNATRMRLYVDGVQQDEQLFTVASGAIASAISTLYFGDNRVAGSAEVNSAYGYFDQIKLYDAELTAAEVSTVYAESPSCSTPGPHHLEVTTSSASGVTCNPLTYTIKACANADCSSTYTTGMSGNLVLSGTPTVNYTSAFTIPAASATTTVAAHITTAGAVTAGLSSLSPVPSAGSSPYCGMGTAASAGGSCVYTANTSGILFSVPNHVAEVSQAVTVSAVRSSDNGLVCTPAFASVNRDVTFKCTYGNPTTGTKAVRVGGAALNASNNAAAVCDATGRAVNLSFDASGVASTTVQYADVGQVGMTAAYTGTGTEAGLSVAGSATFVAAPYRFDVAVTSASPLTAASSFNGTVTARNALNATTPNFGRETSPEGVTLGFARAKPSGMGAVNGTFTGSVGAFTAGVATSTNMAWTEVGQGDVTALLSSGSYLSSGFHVAGNSGNATAWTACAVQGGTCALPTGATALVSYGANGLYKYAAGQTGSVACTNAVFTDPIPAVTKNCAYIVTSGADTTVTGAAGPFRPHHLDLGVTDACSTFTYSGQPFGVTVTARNAASATTLNYDGGLSSSPAQDITLSATTNGGTGTSSNFSVLKGNFAAGVATVTASSTSPSFVFSQKQTSPTSVTVRAVDANGISSSGYAEGSVALRSGQLKFANTFGSEKSNLSVQVSAQHWSGKAWILNSADNCTTVPMAAVGRSNYLDYKGASTAAWSTTASSVVIGGGNGTLSLSAPSPTATGSVDIAFNLGATTTDNACLSSHATTTGANLSWLRARNGNCAVTFDRDPSARITFGVYAPETKRTIHVRELF